MFVTSAKQREGLLIAVITGGRPTLKERPTGQFLDALKAAGFTNIAWIVAEHHAGMYERDSHDLVTYSSQWAYDYAASHWMHTDEVPPVGGFHGAFPGREWACREAERRGCWGVLQLDDNISTIRFLHSAKAGTELAKGNIATFVDLLAGVALSTNGHMVGGQLTSIPRAETKVARPGFPYSFFIEKVGRGREEWFGPFEDDITHAFQYGTRADGATALVVPMLLYNKESKSKTGMRSKYSSTRAVQLQRIFPESARIGIRKTVSNGQGEPRVFHSMKAGAIRNPMFVHNVQLHNAVTSQLQAMLDKWGQLNAKYAREKVENRVKEIRGGKQ